MKYEALTQAFDKAIYEWVNLPKGTPTNHCVILDIDSKDCEDIKNFRILKTINTEFTHHRIFHDAKSKIISSLPSKIYTIKDDNDEVRFAVCCDIPLIHIENIWIYSKENKIEDYQNLININNKLERENSYLKTVIEQQQSIIYNYYQSQLYQQQLYPVVYQPYQEIIYYTANSVEL